MKLLGFEHWGNHRAFPCAGFKNDCGCSFLQFQCENKMNVIPSLSWGWFVVCGSLLGPFKVYGHTWRMGNLSLLFTVLFSYQFCRIPHILLLLVKPCEPCRGRCTERIEAPLDPLFTWPMRCAWRFHTSNYFHMGCRTWTRGLDWDKLATMGLFISHMFCFLQNLYHL